MDLILMNRYQLTTEDCNKTVTDDHLHSISDFYTRDLRSVLQYLDMEVEEDIDYTGKEKKIEFLFKWKQIKGKDATYTRYISALVKGKCLVEVNSVCKLLQQSGSVLTYDTQSHDSAHSSQSHDSAYSSRSHDSAYSSRSHDSAYSSRSHDSAYSSRSHDSAYSSRSHDSAYPSRSRPRRQFVSWDNKSDRESDRRERDVLGWDQRERDLSKIQLKRDLEQDTKIIKQKFAYLLSKILEHLRNKPPREIVNLLSCYDKSYLDFTKECKDTEDLISALISNISFVDYDLLEFLTKHLYSKDETERYLSYNYKSAFNHYLRKRVKVSSHITTSLTLDKEMQIHPSDKKKISQLKKIVRKNINRELDTIDSSLLPVST